MTGMQHIAVYPGTFDPITNGHIDIITRALKIFNKIIVAVGENPSKSTLFTMQERMAMVRESTVGLNVEVDSFNGLLVDYIKSRGCRIIIRSLRAVSDFDYEFQMAVTNRQLDGDLETVFLMTDKEYFYLSSGLVKDIGQKNGKLSSMVPPSVAGKLQEKFKSLGKERQ